MVILATLVNVGVITYCIVLISRYGTGDTSFRPLIIFLCGAIVNLITLWTLKVRSEKEKRKILQGDS